MNSKRTYIATFWRSDPQLKNYGYAYIVKYGKRTYIYTNF